MRERPQHVQERYSLRCFVQRADIDYDISDKIVDDLLAEDERLIEGIFHPRVPLLLCTQLHSTRGKNPGELDTHQFNAREDPLALPRCHVHEAGRKLALEITLLEREDEASLLIHERQRKTVLLGKSTAERKDVADVLLVCLARDVEESVVVCLDCRADTE